MTNTRDDLDALRHIEGFPIGEDEDLHALSDPPYYTAYPNPHIAEFIAQHGKPYDEATDTYHCEPFVGDVSEGKNDPIYNAHSYHTKVPYKAIMPFIEHYTEPGDIVFDGFCGTGMTGVAAQMLGRKAILCDLSPAATFIAYNFNTPVDVTAFEREAKRILQEVQDECGWMYETWHPNCDDPKRARGLINYTVWSDVFLCPYCKTEFVFWDIAVDQSSEKVLSDFKCNSCGAELAKADLTHATNTALDKQSGHTVLHAGQVPVLISYSVGQKRYDKRPDESDLLLIRKIESSEIPYWYPTVRIDRDIDLWYERDYRQIGVYSVDSFFTRRNLWCISAQWARVNAGRQRHLEALKFVLTGNLGNLSKMNRWPRLRGPLAGTLYIPSLYYEINPILAYERRCAAVRPVFVQSAKRQTSILSTESATVLPTVSQDSCDYIFTDPPFGSNIIYSDLSIIWESWLKAFTNTNYEAVVHRRKKEKAVTLDGYREMMAHAFSEMYRILKPGRWMTVVFHNSKASVWNAIQDSLARAGFLIAQVTILDKQQGTFKQVTASGAVKNDLIINAYKPRRDFEERFLQSVGVGQERAFVAQHLEMLPEAANIERSREMLYSRLLAYYVQHGYEIQYSADQFYQLLRAEFKEADGYWFRDEEQLREYEVAKSKAADEAEPQAPLFVLDERSAIQWLKHFLRGNPSTWSEIQPAYFKALQTTDDNIPDPQILLEENFGEPDSAGRYHWPNPNLQVKLDQTRQQRLLRLFADYLRQAQAGQKLADVRKEAVLAGFEDAYRGKRFQEILTVGRKLNKGLVESSTEIYDFIDIAVSKVEA
jgi:DNA modification methylase